LAPSSEAAFAIAKNVPETARLYARQYWPGALTLILEKAVNWDLGDLKDSVAVRVPNSAITLQILQNTGPLAVSSANKTGEPPVETVAAAKAVFKPDEVSVFVDGGTLKDAPPSTIYSFIENRILRSGKIQPPPPKKPDVKLGLVK
jgi:tRNA A37 threonylcarbamoyladenosine synthetase subunit TsaC/SUA5/YrdC